MIRGSVFICIRLTVVQIVLGALPRTAAGDRASMCVAADEPALTTESIQIQVTISSQSDVILGGQFTVHYDPHVLTLMDAAPGRACDATSPFALEILKDDDLSLGKVRCAYGIDFRNGLPPAGVTTTLACLSFAPIGGMENSTSVCLLEGENPFETALVDRAGHAVKIDNAEACPPGDGPSILACVKLAPGVHTGCLPDTTDCHDLDTPCRSGVCDPRTSLCEVAFVNEGGPCDDGDYCTTVDYCREGVCVGEGCRISRLCADSNACIGLIQPISESSHVERQRAMPVQ